MDNIGRTVLVISLLYFSPQFGGSDVPKTLTVEERWEEFKAAFNKTYNKIVETARRLKWEENMRKIKRHNEEVKRGLHNYTLRPNHLADLSGREYDREVITLTRSRRRKVDKELVGRPHLNLGDLPKELDYREKGFVTPPLDQRDCGSCYAFSVAVALQAQVFLKTGKIKKLSVQQIVDCSIVYGNVGCDGGSLRNTLRYLEKTGLTDSTLYPYRGKQGVCRPVLSSSSVKVKSWAVLPAKDEISLMAALVNFGPLPVSINAGPYTFQFYSSGVYDDPLCTSDSVNHAMLLVGYTEKAWILRNWWTDRWGEKGYMYLRKHKNRCGIANFATSLSIV